MATSNIILADGGSTLSDALAKLRPHQDVSDSPVTAGPAPATKAAYFLDAHDNAIVYAEADFRISVNKPGLATHVVLWSRQDKDTGESWVKAGSLAAREVTKKVNQKPAHYLNISSIEIQSQFRGKGFGARMYRTLLDHAAPHITGLISHTPDRQNKSQVPRIYRALGAFFDGDNQIIPRPAPALDIERQDAEQRAIALGSDALQVSRMNDNELRAELFRRGRPAHADTAERRATMSHLCTISQLSPEQLDEQHGITVAADGLIEVDRLTGFNVAIIGVLPIVLYHHTSSALLPIIEKEGLRIGKPTNFFNSQAGVYVTTMGSADSIYGRRAAQAYGGDPISIRIKRTLSQIQPDPDDSDLAWAQGRQFITPAVAPSDVLIEQEEIRSTQSIRPSFAGPNAATANSMALATAKNRIAAGDDAESVRQATGWHKGVEGKWRFEINDADAALLPAIKSLKLGGSEAKLIDSVSYCQNSDGTFDVTLNPPNPQTTRSFVSLVGVRREVIEAVLPDQLLAAISRGEGEEDYVGNFKDAKRLRHPFEFAGFNTLPLDHVLFHPALFAAYPGMRDIMTQVDPRLGMDALIGQLEDGRHVIKIGGVQMLSSLLHETQHGIQDIEGFARGGRAQTNDASLPKEVVAQIEQISEQAMELSLQGRFDEAHAQRDQISGIRRLAGFKRYRALAGEVESRNTQARQHLTSEQRLQTPPSDTADVPESDVIVLFNGAEMANSPTPANATSSPAAPVADGALRACLMRAYGPLFGRLEQAGLVALARTTRHAVTEAAVARAEINGTTVKYEQENVMHSIRQRLRAWHNPATQGSTTRSIDSIDIKCSQKGEIQGFFDPVVGKSFLVEENLDIDTAPGVLIHEVGIHMASNAGFQPLFERAADLVKNGAGDPFFDRVIQRMCLAGETCPEEAAAYLAEEFEFDRLHAPRTVTNWFNGFRTEIRAWLFRKGVLIDVEHLGPAEIAAVARANARSLITCIRRDGELHHSIAAGRCASPWFSELARQVQALKQSVMPAEQFAQWIQSLTTKGVKPDEIEWSGVLDWLKLQTGKVSKTDVTNFLASNGVQIEEQTLRNSPQCFTHVVFDWKGSYVQEFDDEDEANEFARAKQDQTDMPHKVKSSPIENLDGAQYSDRVLKGGSNYRELLLMLPVLPAKPVPFDVVRRAALKSKVILSLDEHDELQAMNGVRKQADYKSGHWTQPNVLAHVRVDDRLDADGKRVLMVHELQSDWGQAGRKQGFRPVDIDQQKELYKTEMEALYPLGQNDMRRTPDEVARGAAIDKASTGVPIAPFVTSTTGWLSLALKRVIKLAVDEGYDKVAIISGKQSANSFKLSNRIDQLHWRERRDGKHVRVDFESGDGLTLVVDASGTVVRTDGVGQDLWAGRLLNEITGMPISEKIIRESSGALSGEGLNIGGEGMIKFYDQIVPAAAKDMLKMFGRSVLQGVKVAHDQGLPPEPLNGNAQACVETTEQFGFVITQDMRRKVSGAMPVFGRAGASPDVEQNAEQISDYCAPRMGSV